jgi:predicted alpha/beta superfamily hydrolase
MATRPKGSLGTWGPVSWPGFPARTLRLYTPPGYHEGEARPLLVLFDGQNVFDDGPSFAGGWRAHEAVEKLASGRPRPLVLGIDNGGGERLHEMAPWAAHGSRGQADRFLDGVVDRAIAEARRRVHVIAGAVGCAVGGSSLGGLLALYAHFHRPDIFGGSLAMSPSIWFQQRRLLDWLEQRPVPMFSRIYLDAGALELRGGLANLVRSLGDGLARRGYGADRLMVRVDRKGAHNEMSWRRRLPGALRYLYRL